MRVVAVVVGLALVAAVLAAAVDALVSTRLRSGTRRSVVDFLTRGLWAVFRLAARGDDMRRERVLSLFAPVLLLTLLTVAVAVQITGWGLVWWGLRATQPQLGLSDSVYYSGVVYFTVGFGEIVPVTVAGRVCAVVEAFTGLLIIALSIGYLPALYGAYSQREQQLLRLDDASERQMSPASIVLEAQGDVSRLDSFFADWERWVAAVLESHTSYPMLAYFRSQHPGQSWVTALGLVTDAAVTVIVLQGARSGPAFRLYRRAVRTFTVITSLLGVQPKEGEFITREMFNRGHELWTDGGFTPPPLGVAFDQMTALRAPYAGRMEALIDHLAAPRGFWGHRLGL